MALVEPGMIETFLVLAEELHFGRTAQRRGVSPQRVSQVIQALERKVGGPLFDRTSRRVRLTPLGAGFRDELLPHYQGVQEAFANAAAVAHGRAGVLRVGFVGALWGGLLVRAAEALRAERPAVRIALIEITPDQAQRLQPAGLVDATTASLPVVEPGVTAGPVLLREPRVLAVPTGHPLARRSRIRMEDLAGVPLLDTPTMPDDWVAERTPHRTPGGTPIQRGPQAESVNQALALIAAGLGAYPFGAQVNRYYRHPGVTYLPIDDAAPLEWCLAWATDARTPLLQIFARQLRALIAAQPA
ncbi:LysR family transcriptional regulator [Actinomadura macrotermitis]|nr:LysR substrate-binding domain-containing protein [Actinomadura macrotermitis]